MGYGAPPAGAFSGGTTWFSQGQSEKPFRSFDGLFFRTEYLLWSFSKPGNQLLGSPVLGVPDPTVPRDIFDPLGNFIGTASVPSLAMTQLRNVSGARETVGIPLVFGSFEGNVFGFGRVQDRVVRTDLVGTSTFVNGQLADNIELYNAGFSANMVSQLWGAETNIFIDGPRSNLFSLKPMIGFRYLNLEENLYQRGTFVPDPTTGLAPINSQIDSGTLNNIFLPQIGLRTQFETKYVTVTIDPKFGLGPNKYHNLVRTYHFRSNGDPEVITTDDATQLAPVVDLGVTGKLNITPKFSLTAGYNLLYVSGISRPQGNIFYNDNGPLPTPPGVVVQTNKTDIIFYGLSLGGEFRY
jgi:hypothetical protein